jgi:hypothetical protein
MQLQFQGAARTVTGSMHVLTVGIPAPGDEASLV